MMIIDTREPEKMRAKALDMFKDSKLRELEFGDYQTDNIIVERKTISDFVSSYTSQHLQKQLIGLSECKNAFLIISGKFQDLWFKNHSPITIKQYLGMLASVNLRYNVRVLQVENDNQLLELIEILDNHVAKGDVIEFTGEKRFVEKELPEMVKTLMLINGISKELASRIYAKYPNLITLKASFVKDKTEGIGKKKKENILKFINKIMEE